MVSRCKNMHNVFHCPRPLFVSSIANNRLAQSGFSFNRDDAFIAPALEAKDQLPVLLFLVAIKSIAASLPFGYTCRAAAKSAVGIDSPEFKGGHTATSAVFLCPKHGKPVLWAGRVGALRGCRFPLSRSVNPHGSALPVDRGRRKTIPHQRNFAMIPDHSLTQNPLTLRELAKEYRRQAMAALWLPTSDSVRLSRYWSNIGRARALEALDHAGLVLTVDAVQGGDQ